MSFSSRALVLKILIGFVQFFLTLSVSQQHPIGSSIVADWVRGKCGESGQRLWRYHGALYDPLDGRKVASVEGLEWVSLLRKNETSDRPIYSDVLNHPNATWNHAATLWSKHLFCYTLGDGGKENATLLQSIRIRPYSPEKPIPLEQAAAVYETASTFIETSNGEVIVYSEWPSPQHQNSTISIWGSTSVKRSSEDGSIGFSVYCKRRSPKSPLFLPDLSPKEPDSRPALDGNATITVSPKRAKWVEFGMSNMETKHKFGARETYSISSPFLRRPSTNSAMTAAAAAAARSSSSRSRLQFRLFGMPSIAVAAGPKLTYSRYGEGPPFYAPGRMCMLELQAEPIDSVADASPILRRLLKERVEGWDTPIFGQEKIRFLPSEEDQDLLATYKGYTIKAWEKARSVSNVVSLFRKENAYWNKK